MPTRYVTALAGVAAVAVFLVAGGLFFVLPRVGLATLPLRARLGQMITGFSERVELGSYGSILTDSNVVMRVHLPDEVQPDRYPNLRWRGVVLDTFDGQAWSVRYPRQTRLVRPSSGGFDVGLLRGSGLFLRQEIFLEPIGSEVVFAAPRVLRLSMPTSVLAMDDMGAVSVVVPRRPAPVHGRVRAGGPVGPERGPRAPGAAARRRRSSSATCSCPSWRRRSRRSRARSRGRARRRRRSPAAWRRSCGPSSATRSTSSG